GVQEEADRSSLLKLALAENKTALRYHVLTAYHAAATGSNIGEESFLVAQWALETDAAEALRQMAVRFAAGDNDLSRLVREQQDLLQARRVADSRLLAAIGAANPESIAEHEKTYRNIEGQLNRIVARLQKEFPEYGILASPQPLTITATQMLL